ncbi:MAG TPA: hypothetical protein VFF52_26850 [Isosphaeraceae bacterium]|nr:hypothetical protein [Isosphaeraceae bacterium]
MRRTPVRFTIRSLMIAVAVAAGLLNALVSPIGLVVAFGLAYLALIGGTWWMFHGFRRLAALSFGVVAALNNIVSAGVCIHRLNMGGVMLMFLVWLLAFPFVFGAGAAWATAVTRRAARPQRSPFLAWPLVLVLAILPLTMLLTRWPFHLAFLASTQALDRLADRVAAGQGIASPEWAGLFRVVGSAVDPSSGDVGLIIDPEPSGRSGFVRVVAAPSVPAGGSSGPFYNLYLDLKLRDRWRYECED